MICAAAIGIDVDIGQLDQFLPELDQPRVERFIELADADITILGPVALPEKFSALLSENPHFHLSWERRRPDLRDQTLSGYEMSLASIAANAGWTAQQISHLLVAFRKKEKGRWHGRSYYRSTIGKALGQAAKHRRDQLQGAFQAHEAESGAKEEEHSSAEPNDKAKLLAELNRAWILKDRNLHFTDVKRRGSCYMAFDDLGHEIHLGTVREMNAFFVTQANIAEATGINLSIPGGKKATFWFPVVERFINIAHSQPIEFDYGLEEETRNYLARALNALTSHNPEYAQCVNIRNIEEELYLPNLSLRTGLRGSFLHYDLEGRAPKCWPRFIFWTDDGQLWVQVPVLQMFLGTPVGGNERITTDRLKQGLAMMRFAIDQIKTGQIQSQEIPGIQSQKISLRWCISPPAFELDPDCNPQPGLNLEGDPNLKQPP